MYSHRCARFHRPTHTASSGFTLIELLIVIAIILILIAIALPNFLAAQVRARVTENIANQRSMSIGVASYRIDWGQVPMTPYEPSATFNKLGQISDMYGMLFMCTTPTAYINSVPESPFDRADPIYGEGSGLEGAIIDRYGYFPMRCYNREWHNQVYGVYEAEIPTVFWWWAETSFLIEAPAAEFVQFSFGPHGGNAAVLTGPNEPGFGYKLVPYSPTNGLKSEGNIMRFDIDSEFGS